MLRYIFCVILRKSRLHRNLMDQISNITIFRVYSCRWIVKTFQPCTRLKQQPFATYFSTPAHVVVRLFGRTPVSLFMSYSFPAPVTRNCGHALITSTAWCLYVACGLPFVIILCAFWGSSWFLSFSSATLLLRCGMPIEICLYGNSYRVVTVFRPAYRTGAELTHDMKKWFSNFNRYLRAIGARYQ